MKNNAGLAFVVGALLLSGAAFPPIWGVAIIFGLIMLVSAIGGSGE